MKGGKPGNSPSAVTRAVHTAAAMAFSLTPGPAVAMAAAIASAVMRPAAW